MRERERERGESKGREDVRSTDKASPLLPPLSSSLNGYYVLRKARGRKDGRTRKEGRRPGAGRGGLSCN